MTLVYIIAAWVGGIFTPRVYNSVKANVLYMLARRFK